MSQNRHDTPQYYMPYDSAEDSGADSGQDSGEESDVSDFEDPRIRREEDPRYAIIRAAGPNFDTYQQQLNYIEHPYAGEYNPKTDITSLEGLRYLNPPKTSITSLLSIKSSNRDVSVYPSPYYFSLKTPRIYKNVTKFQLIQISFPNNNSAVGSPSTFVSSIIRSLLTLGVDPCCISSCVENTDGVTGSNSIGIIEQGRLNDMGQPMLTTLSVPNGNYSNGELAQELTLQANNTPPFNLISYEDFKEVFQTTRDITVLFNEPGDSFQSNLTKIRYSHFTKETIMNCYYTRSHIDSFAVITDKIAFNAYYYPVMKELLATDRALPFVRSSRIDFDTIRDVFLQQFLGLNSDVYYDVCLENQSVLDSFRRYRTFRFRNINQYTWKWDEETRMFAILHDKLHASIQRDIQNKLQQCFQHEQASQELHLCTYHDLKAEFPTVNSIYRHLASNLSTVLANYHFVSGYRYSGGVYHSTLESTFHMDSLQADSTFTSMFQYTSVFGNQYGNLPGMRFTFTSFTDYHSTLSSYYTRVQTMESTMCGIHDAAYERTHQYVAKKYQHILPAEMIHYRTYHNGHAVPIRFAGDKPYYVPGESVAANVVSLQSNPNSVAGSGAFSQIVPLSGAGPYNQNTTGPCGTSTCSTLCGEAITKLVASWYGCLPVTTTYTSLNYRLGLSQFNLTNVQFGSTLLSALSTNFDYFLQINEEQGFNNMDVAMDEDYNISNETTGQIKLMACKILTGGLGSGETANSVIQNPVLFENYLGKLDKLSFKIYYNDGPITPAWLLAPFKDLAFNEWEATFQIEEAIAFADRNKGFGLEPTIPIPADPNAMPYLGFANPNDPNNKG